MSKYDVTYSCGHEGVVNIIGPVKDREWKRQNEESKMCPDCWRKEIEAEREQKNREAAEKATEMELPELTGSPKQIAWANTLRQELIDKFDQATDDDYEYLTDRLECTKDEAIRIEHYILENKTQARFYIDRRDQPILRWLDYVAEEALKSEKEKAKEVNEKALKQAVEEEIKAEATLLPKEAKTHTVAEIITEGNAIKVHFPEMNEDFRKTARYELNMKWDSPYWKREILPRHGSVEDRGAEIGYTLLANGFVVRIDDPEIREKTISADFEKEHTRWILAVISGDHEGWLVVSWNRPDDFYKAAKRISGSRYSRPNVVIPPENFDEVLDFAETYGFEISETAQKVINAAREQKEKSIIVDAEKKSRDGVVADGKPQPLEVPEKVEIHEEFRDKD